MNHHVTAPHPQVVYLPFVRRPTTATGEWSLTHVPVRIVLPASNPGQGRTPATSSGAAA